MIREPWWLIRISVPLFSISALASFPLAFAAVVCLSPSDARAHGAGDIFPWVEAAVLAVFVSVPLGGTVAVAWLAIQRGCRNLLALKESINVAVVLALAVCAVAIPAIDALQGGVQLALPALAAAMMAVRTISLQLFLAVETILLCLAIGGFVVVAARYLRHVLFPRA